MEEALKIEGANIYVILDEKGFYFREHTETKGLFTRPFGRLHMMMMMMSSTNKTEYQYGTIKESCKEDCKEKNRIVQMKRRFRVESRVKNMKRYSSRNRPDCVQRKSVYFSK